MIKVSRSQRNPRRCRCIPKTSVRLKSFFKKLIRLHPKPSQLPEASQLPKTSQLTKASRNQAEMLVPKSEIDLKLISEDNLTNTVLIYLN
jgi:hypothetical protein